jgi:hypothetical protein
MTESELVVQKVRHAIKDRALYLVLLYRSFSQALPADQAEKLARQAIFEYGTLRGMKDSGKMTPETWIDSHVKKGSAAVFGSRIIKAADHCEQQMTYCPLVEAWQELGCSPEEIDLLCDIAMEGDRGRAAYHKIPMEITHRIAVGDPYCCLVLKNIKEH